MSCDFTGRLSFTSVILTHWAAVALCKERFAGKKCLISGFAVKWKRTCCELSRWVYMSVHVVPHEDTFFFLMKLFLPVYSRIMCFYFSSLGSSSADCIKHNFWLVPRASFENVHVQVYKYELYVYIHYNIFVLECYMQTPMPSPSKSSLLWREADSWRTANVIPAQK